jgi:hypothetical protein
MSGLPKKIRFLASMPLIAGDPAPSPPPPSFPVGDLICGGGSVPKSLEPYRFSPDSVGWYGGIEQLEDEFVLGEEEYVGSKMEGAALGVEFPVPTDLDGGSGIFIAAKSVNASSAQISLDVQYFELETTLWTTVNTYSINLTGSYGSTYIDNVLSALPFDAGMTKIRVMVTAASIVASGLQPGEVRVNHLTIPYCSTVPSLLPPPPVPPPPLSIPTQNPDEIGTLPPFFAVGAPLPPLPPSPPSTLPPLPPGTEILRPNRDILVRLWNPRPAYMQLNDPLDLDHPVDATIPLFGPATVDVFDESSGNFTGTLRPRVEVGFTAPVGEGPWDALQLRFRAARSRPPQPEPLSPPLPDPLDKTPASRECPPDQSLFPRGTDFPGIWQNPPLEAEINDPVDSPVNTCFMSAPVQVPAGAAGQVALTPSPIDWTEGWDQIKVRVVARARTTKQEPTDRKIVGVGGRIVQFDPVHAGLPPGGPAYQVRWNPFDCNNRIHAFQQSITEIRGTGILQTNLDIHAEFFLSSQDSDHVEVQVSTDGKRFYGSVIFDLGAFKSTVIYYRIALNKGGQPSPSGNIAIGAGLIITGPYVVTGIDVATYPRESAPFVITVSQSIISDLPLVSQCRIGISPQGNMELVQAPVQYTDILTTDWRKYELTWNGFWAHQHIKDLRIRMSPEALNLVDDVPFIDVSAMDVIISPFCPGLSQPLSPPLISLNQVEVLPVADVLVTEWAPTPAWTFLVADPTLVAKNAVSADPRESNQLLIAMGVPQGLPGVAAGYTRQWTRIEVILQARLITLSSINSNILVSTNFGQERGIPFLTNTTGMYSLIWDYDQPLTLDQVSRLKVALIANISESEDQFLVANDETPILDEVGEDIDVELDHGYDSCQVAVSSVRVRLTFQDVLTNPPVLSPPPPPFDDGIMAIVESSSEVFSCGSLGGCASPQGRVVGKVTVTNPDGGNATVNFIATDEINLRISDASNNSYSLSQTIAGGASVTYFIYGWVGNSGDPFPVDPVDGEILISLIYSGGVHRISIPWYYIGL